MFGLGAAALFGVSAPLARGLLPRVGPLTLAGLLYLGAALALSSWKAVRRGPQRAEAQLRRSDWPSLVGVIVLGGMGGPVLMLLGLPRLSAVSGALMLNLEAVLTLAVAVVVFKEHAGRRFLLSAALVVGAALWLARGPGSLAFDPLGLALLAGACACWAFDNNLSQRLSLKDPVAVVRVKTLSAGAANLLLSRLASEAWPDGSVLAWALLLGAFSYGLSLLFDQHALRLLGAAREAVFFATAPFIGALVAMLLERKPGLWGEWVAGGVMAAGVALLLGERHRHLHRHAPLEHEHLHHHDAHHQHLHGDDAPPGEPHSHSHRHEPLEHEHEHVPDVHHRHTH